MTRAGEAFDELVRIMDRMRSPGGCPWDGEQTHASLVRYLIEESYEVVEAIEAPDGVDAALLREELGDVLLQVVFHARVADEGSPSFDIADVVEGLNAKLVRRHPHVFADDPRPRERTEERTGGASETDLEALTRTWDELKRREKPGRTGPFDGVPPALPALALAEKTLNKAAKASIPLPERVDIVDAAEGRTVEVSPESVAAGGHEAEERAVGEALLGVVAHCRDLGVDPEKALRRAVREYVRHASAGGDS